MSPIDPDNFLEVREAHYERSIGPLTEQVYHSLTSGEVHVDIYQFPPTEGRPYWTLITGGMSDAPMHLPEDAEGDAPRAEILIYVEEPKPWMFSVLKGLAEMPFEEATFLGRGHTVPNGRPMTAEPSELTSFVFFPPFFEDEGFDTLEIGGDPVNILWMIPITEAERRYAVENGSQALSDVFAEKGLDPVVDEGRSSLVEASRG